MDEKRNFVCIVCPKGCALEVDCSMAPDAIGPGPGGPAAFLAVRGNACKRGEAYARSEVVDPRRSLTSTVRVADSKRRRLPVRSSGELPLGRLREAARALEPIVARPPIRCGDIVARDLLGLGIDLVATDDLPSEA